MTRARARAVRKGSPCTPRPITFVSMPAPLMFLPISSMMSTSISAKGSAGIQDRAWASSAGSRASMAAAGMTSTRARWWCGSSTRPTPAISGTRLRTRREAARMEASYPWRAAARWAAPAPSTLPRPMAHIFKSPLPRRVLSKSVCGFTRLTTTRPSASSASRAQKTGTPASVRPISTVSTEARMGTPIEASVMP